MDVVLNISYRIGAESNEDVQTTSVLRLEERIFAV